MPYPRSATPPSVIKKRKHAAQELEDFEADLRSRAPDMALLLSKIYTLTEKMVDKLSSQDQFTSKDINALTALTRALPTLQTAEQNHKASIKGKTAEDMSIEELRAIAVTLVKGEFPYSESSGLVAPTLNAHTENESLGAFPTPEGADGDE
jgi:hypothetical protein